MSVAQSSPGEHGNPPQPRANETIPFVDLQAQHRSLADELERAVRQVARNGDFVLGSAVGEFERAFAEFLGAKHAVSVGSGLDALTLALMALDIGPADEVILPANSYIATAFAVSRVGALPVFVDCNVGTFNIDASRIQAAVTPRTRAVIPVHLTGQPADMEAVLDAASRHQLKVVEDAAQAQGAFYRGRACGTLGDAGCFSFYPGKNLGAWGDAGLVCTNDPAVVEMLTWLRNYGQRDKNHHVVQGVNSRMDTLQAAVLGVKLPRLRGWNQERAEHAALYRKLLAGVGDVEFQTEVPGGTHIYHLFVIQTAHRDGLRRHLHERGIQTGIHYPVPIHLQPAYAQLGYASGSFPVAERLAERSLSLPMYPELQPAQIERVVAGIRAWFEGSRRRPVI